MTRDHPFDGLVGRLQGLGLPPPCYPSYGAPTFTPVGLTPTEWASLRWTHRLARRSLALRPAHSRCHQFVARFTEGFNRFVTSTVAPVASGWSCRRVGLSPTGKAPPFHGARQERSFTLTTLISAKETLNRLLKEPTGSVQRSTSRKDVIKTQVHPVSLHTRWSPVPGSERL
jgi:hypothetical protein